MNENNFCKIKQITFENFRNLETKIFEPKEDFNFFHGENAQGKTSILEALFFLSELKSFRSSDYKNLIAHQRQNFFLSALIDQDGLEHQISIQVSPSGKQVQLNGKTPRPFSKLRQILPIVYFTPDSVRLFRISPSERRDYFDRFFSLLSAEFTEVQERYSKIHRQKNLLLERLREKNNFSDREELQSWNEQLSYFGARLYSLRQCFTGLLDEKLQDAFFDLSGESWKAQIEYRPYFEGLMEAKAEEIQDLLLIEMERREGEELERGQVLVGPHRDDWFFLINSFLLKEEGSQGQHRVAVASLKLVEIDILRQFGKVPVALFDDLLSELDSKRSELMMEKLFEHSCQVFLTSIKPYGLETQKFSKSLFKIEKGCIKNE
ncbi:MAG: DNA replication and repair protein RecF [Deltaproteobacteria bacterium]|nr:DNA replication and repair protein RecF [Deltaproteobacteria bacterium]